MISLWPILVAISCLTFGIRADGNVGCLLSKRVCGKHEWCYDDFAFGRCLPLYERISTDDLYRYGLEKEALKQLESEIRRLFTAGYRWAHSYTQCIVKKILRSFRYKVDFTRNKCENKQDDDLERALTYLEAEHEIDPKDIAIIKFQPSLFDDASVDYGDELYFPSTHPEPRLMQQDGSYVGVVKKYPAIGGSASEEVQHKGEHHDHKSKLLSYERRKKNSKEQHYDNKPLTEDEVMDLLNLMNYVNQDSELMPEEYRLETEQEEPKTWSFAKHKNSDFLGKNPFYYKEGNEESQEKYPSDFGDFASFESYSVDPTIAFERPHRYDVKKPGPYFKVNNYVFEKEEQENDDNVLQEPRIFKFHPMFEEQDPSVVSFRHQHLSEPAEDLTAEGMSSPVKENEKLNGENETRFPLNDAIKREDVTFNEDIPIYLNSDSDDYFSPENLQFGGLFNQEFDDGNREESVFVPDYLDDKSAAKQYPFQKEFDGAVYSSPELRNTGSKHEKIKGLGLSDTGKRHFASHANLVAPDMSDMKENSKQTFEPTGDPEHYDVVDTSYAYVIVDKGFTDWKEAKDYTKVLQTLLGLPERTFSNIRRKANKVTFKVKNSDGVNASIVATKAETFKDQLLQKTGKHLISAGIGDKAQLAVEELENDNRIFVYTFIVCGVIAGAVIAVGVLYVVRRHARSREKLQNLTHLDTEASQDYQDLCRQRMASKTTEKPEPIHVAQRISSLSRDSETSVRSPSSRSSTSSWNEEPVISNMDISTGHMVLSYMEDHLTNKDRLDQEWVALCAYEADPSVVDAAIQPNNIKKNRYEDILPYDHSRVVLNDLTNIAGSDYINASSITDHDPRNPAYIATQGPLPHTSADFWQMIWEQGSVVIVMLTRLVENGVAMCHRYWPEEGSELYHIYEVHLVSEHIWCEDYLVRSFYLKNLKTGETRTVTQFHFLSWPDNGVANSTKALLDFRRKVNKSYRGRSCPIVVHCSDGIGRTGTYCLIDMVLNRMAKGAKEIDIAATLEHIRDQRTAMVRTKAQFEFALMAVAEEVHAILKAMPQ